MFDVTIMRIQHIIDHYRLNGIKSLFHEILFYKRRTKIIEKKLNDVVLKNDALIRNNINFRELTIDLIEKEKYIFKYKSRYYKSLYYLKKGYGGHCIVKDNEIIGDVWYCPKCVFGKNKVINKDVNLFKLNFDDKCVYSFDTFVSPEYRGNNIAATFINNHLYFFSIYGFEKAYGYYWDDNLAAKWNNRVLNKWPEIKTILISRFFVKKIVHNYDNINNMEVVDGG